MNRTLKKLIFSEYKKLITLTIIFILSLVLSAVIYLIAGQENLNIINYDNIKNMTVWTVFLRVFKRNIVYFAAVILLTCIGQSKIINVLFGLMSVYYGLSVIYLIKIIKTNKLYFVFTFTDYFIFFPLLFYFTYISSAISKYTKKTKKIETISNKFDIIITSYIKISVIYLLIISAYSLGYSYFILILSRMLVK